MHLNALFMYPERLQNIATLTPTHMLMNSRLMLAYLNAFSGTISNRQKNSDPKIYPSYVSLIMGK